MNHIKGNLITELDEGRIEVAAHCANCQKTMGSGIALALKQKWPLVYQADLDYVDLPANRLGNISIAEVKLDRAFVVNLYGQLDFGYGSRQINYEALYSALEKMKSWCYKMGVQKVGFPKNIGSCRAGGNVRIIEVMIEEVFKDFEVFIVELE